MFDQLGVQLEKLLAEANPGRNPVIDDDGGLAFGQVGLGMASPSLSASQNSVPPGRVR